MKGSSAKAKGSQFERELAQLMGGKRTPLSGANGGGDLTFPSGSIWADWSHEAKRRACLPILITNAMRQAELDIGIGGRRKPMVHLRPDRGRSITCCYTDDLVTWAQALAEVGSMAHLRSLLRDLERATGALKTALYA
jgi:hypothetical protein